MGSKYRGSILQKLTQKLTIDEMQFGFMPEKGTNDSAFILRRLQEDNHARGKKLYMSYVDLEKAFDRVPRKVLKWSMMKKGIPKVLIKSVMSLYEGAKTKVRVDLKLSERFVVKVGCTKDLCCHHFFLQLW